MVKSRAGFVYLDVLLAVLVLAGSGLFLKEFTAYSRAVLTNAAYTTAVYLTQAEMEKLKSGYSKSGEVSCMLNGRKFYLKSNVETVSSDDNLQKITVETHWQEFSADKVYRLVLWKER